MAVRFMMATKATHKIGDVSSEEPELCYIHREDDDNYIGDWAEGLGLIDVKFPKETTRELTTHERLRFSKMKMFLNGHVIGSVIDLTPEQEKEIKLLERLENPPEL